MLSIGPSKLRWTRDVHVEVEVVLLSSLHVRCSTVDAWFVCIVADF